MIRNEQELKRARRSAAEQEERLRDAERQLQDRQAKPDEIKRTLDPIRSLHLQILEEIEEYERLIAGGLPGLRESFGELGTFLIRARIAAKVTQKELATRLDVDESQVSRDERNEYHGITKERAERILEALGADVVVSIPAHVVREQ